jgi:hypothetical protein
LNFAADNSNHTKYINDLGMPMIALMLNYKYNILIKQPHKQMGGENSKIDTSSVPIASIMVNASADQGSFCPPFRKFGAQSIEINNR